jgi:aminobenzoyl-glutamate utilization protein B
MHIGHVGLVQAAKVLALATAELMQDQELVKIARDEFEEQIKITPYESPLSDDATPPFDYFRRVYEKQI